MKTTLTILLTALTVVTFGQITTTKVAPKMDTVHTPYDSLDNFVGINARKYIGQELYLKGLTESSRKYGYDGFVIDYTKDRYRTYVRRDGSPVSIIYQCCAEKSEFNSKYDSLNEKYFKVLDVINHPTITMFYLKLEEKESKDIIYYEYQLVYEDRFPFIVVGFFEKQKKIVIGQEFVFADKVLESSTDIQTGKQITVTSGQTWKCTDLTIEEKDYRLALVIENSLGEKATIPHWRVFEERKHKYAYTATETANYRKKFGKENFDRILKGKVKIGFTKEMCKLSWGEPDSINETITSGKRSEQWVYSDNYLYFDNDILTAMQ